VHHPRRFFRSALLSAGTLLAGAALALPGVAHAAPTTDTAPKAATGADLRAAAAPEGFTPGLTPYGQNGQYGTTERTVVWTPPADEQVYQCRLDDNAEWSACADPDTDAPGFQMTGLDYGVHHLTVESSPDGGTMAPYATYEFVVQVEAPTISEPPTDGPDTRRDFYFSAYFGGQTDYAVECNIDGAGFVPCPDNGRLELEGLKQGAHQVEIRQAYVAVDRTLPGHTSETTTTTFDVTAPHAPRIAEGPSGTVDTTYAFFRLDQENADWYVGNIECSLDGAEFAACSDYISFQELSQGEHVFRARQNVDGINPSAVTERRWIVNGTRGDEPTGPQFGDAPVQTPAPTPAPAPAPTPTPEVELQTPSAPFKAKSAAIVGRSLTVGCAVPGATSYRCEVTVSKGGKRLGHAVRTGNGTVRIKLTRAGARRVQRAGGLTVRVQVKATVNGQTTVTTKTVRILPTKTIVLSTDELFGSSDDEPTAAGKLRAEEIAVQLSGARQITVVGHTDAKGSDAANERRGLARARAFAALLRSEGLKGTKVVVQSAGETKPRATNATARGRELNRRVEVSVRY
jgi:outer membrane protein OmpA-like peptidoglycan-associated protein